MKATFSNLMFTLIISFCYCTTAAIKKSKTPSQQCKVLKLEMFLNAFGVESDGFPTINASIDFSADSGIRNVSYYEPWLKSKQYSFSKKQIDTLRSLLANADLKNIKKAYVYRPSDQPTSVTTIYTEPDTFMIKDYGLQAEAPLRELYRIVYDLKTNFR